MAFMASINGQPMAAYCKQRCRSAGGQPTLKYFFMISRRTSMSARAVKAAPAYQQGSLTEADIEGRFANATPIYRSWTPSQQQQQGIQVQGNQQPDLPPVAPHMEPLETAFLLEDKATTKDFTKAFLRLLYCELVARAWQRVLQVEEQAAAEQQNYEAFCLKQAVAFSITVATCKVKLSQVIMQKVLPFATHRTPASKKCLPLSDIFTCPGSQPQASALTNKAAEARTGLARAKTFRQKAAAKVAYVLLRDLNGINSRPGLDWDSIPEELLSYALALMYKSGYADFYGRPCYRTRWILRDSLSIKQYCHLKAMQPPLCADDGHSYWDSSIQLQPHPHPVCMPVEVEKQLSSELVMGLLRFGSGIGAGLAAVAGELQLIDARSAAAAGRAHGLSGLQQLHLRWYKLVAARLQPKVFAAMVQPLLASPGSAAAASSKPSCSNPTTAAAVCSNGEPAATAEGSGYGGSVRRGSLTAVGGDAEDSREEVAGVLACPQWRQQEAAQQQHQQCQMHVTPLVVDSSSSSTAGSSNVRCSGGSRPRWWWQRVVVACMGRAK